MRYFLLAICLISCVGFSTGNSAPSCFLLQVNNNTFEPVYVYTTFKHRLVMEVDSAASSRSWIDTDDLSVDRTLALTLEAVKHPGYINIPPFRAICEGETVELNLGIDK